MDIVQNILVFIVNILTLGLVFVLPYSIMLSRFEPTLVFGRLVILCSLIFATLIYVIRTTGFNLSNASGMTSLMLLAAVLVIAGLWAYQEAYTLRQKIFSPEVRYRFANHFFEFILLAAIYETLLLILFRTTQIGAGFLVATITMVVWPQLTKHCTLQKNPTCQRITLLSNR